MGGTQDLQGGTKGDTGGRGYTGGRETGATGAAKCHVCWSSSRSKQGPSAVRGTVLYKPGNTELHVNGICSFTGILRGSCIPAGGLNNAAAAARDSYLFGATVCWKTCTVHACKQRYLCHANVLSWLYELTAKY